MTADLNWSIPEPGAWEIDAVHYPTPITAYHASILQAQFPRGFAEGARRVGLLLSHFDHHVVNGFDYIAPRIVGAPKSAQGPPPRLIFQALLWLHPEMRRRVRTAASAFDTRPWREDVRLWETEVRPASTAAHTALRAESPAGLDDAALADLLVRLRANAETQYYLHHRFTVPALVPVGDFIVHTREWTGLSPGELLQACRQPAGVVTVARQQFEAALAAIKCDDVALGSLGSSAPAAEILAGLASRHEAVRAWLEMTGDRLVTGYDIVDLTANEMPALLVHTLQAALDDTRARRAAEAREAHLVAVRDRVPAQHRAAFDALLGEATAVSNLREERALVCDFWAYGLVRRAVLEAGRRLASRGRLQDARHLLEGSHEEMLGLLVRQEGPSATDLAARHAWRTNTTCDVAPPRLGFPPSGPPPLEWMPASSRRAFAAVDAAVTALFAEPEARSEPKVVRGIPASAGVVEGTARVVLRPDDFPRIRPGDVLVARMTTEAYNGILPMLAAAVTDRGGLLSHTATVAREFGIPAVVGSRDATRLLPDGARVRVDGNRGEVRVLG
jgi:pyruvate,water dikinase